MFSTFTQRVFTFISVLPFACWLSEASARAQQTGTVQGTVVEAGTGRPLANAQMFVADPGVTLAASTGRISTTTDAQGRYVISGVPAGQVQLHVRTLGYASQRALLTVMAAQTSTLDFQLNRSVFALDEIVVSGAGGRVERKRLGNTIATVDATALEAAPVATFSEMLQAREPSVVALPSGGLAGESTRIRIRGSNSISTSNEPVVYVDGVRVDNSGGLLRYRLFGGVPSQLDDINPEAVERIEVLKGAAAATLYGSEASSGVIQIFTKKGRSGRPRFMFRIDQGISQVPDVIKPNAGFARDAEQAASMSELFGIPVQPFEIVERTFAKDMLGTGRQQAYSASVAGGSDDFQYYAAGRAAFTDGPFGAEELGPARDFNRRYQGNVALVLFPRDRIQFRVNGAFTDAHNEAPVNSNDVRSPFLLALSSKPERASCDQSSLDASARIGESTPMCTGAGNATGAPGFATVRETMQRVNGEDTEHFNASLSASYAATPSLNIEGLVGLDAVNARASDFAPFGWDVDGIVNLAPEGYRWISSRNHREITLETKLRWDERILANRMASHFVLGMQGFIADTRRSGGYGERFPGPGISIAGGSADQVLEESSLSKVNLGILAQEQIGLDDLVFLTVGGRWDRHSAFGENAGAAFYPKASVSIIPSDLSTWRSSLLSTVRLRAAVGESGLQPGAFDKYTTFRAAPTAEGPGVQPENVGNPDLEPETSTEWELGAELGLLDNRVGIDVTYWDRVTRDALIPRRYAPTGGFSNSQLDNIGELRGNGWELKLDALVVDGEDVTLSVFATASFLEEMVTDMGGAAPIKVGGTYPRVRNYLKEGFAPGTYFGSWLLPLCESNPVYTGGLNEGEPRRCWTPGSTVPFDSNGDGAPDTEAEFKNFLTATEGVPLDQAAMNPLLDDEDGDGDLLDHRLGKPTPDWSGSFGLQFTLFSNLAISSLFEYRTGHYGVANLTDAFRRSHALWRNTQESAAVEAALLNPATQGDAEARLAAAMTWANELASLYPCCSGLNLVEKADFVRWRELSLTYTAPTSFARKLGLDDLAISLTGRNLHLFTDYSGLDPESNSIGVCQGGGADRQLNCNFVDSIDSFGIPLPRRYAISVRFGF